MSTSSSSTWLKPARNPPNRTRYSAAACAGFRKVTVMNIGFFLAPLAVAPLTAALGARELVLLLGALRLIGGLLFTINPVRVAAAKPAATT
jgi:hypothetical protein